jgi:inosine-uridine nucleoside N-ribohydrolase
MLKQKVIIDCDNTMGLPGWEVDDGLVLLYLLGREDIEILGITNTFGNGSLKNVVKYTKQMLLDINRKDIPQFDGEPYLNKNTKIALDIRSRKRYDKELPPQDFPSDAAQFLVDQANTYPGEISILALGPVGNLYDAWKLDNSFYSKTKEIVLMGGYTQELYIGGINCRELNLSCNPEAAYSMLNAECPVVIFNGHICLQAPFSNEDMKRINFWPESRKQMILQWLKAFSGHFPGEVFYLWDLLPAVYLSYPELFDLKKVNINPTVTSLHRGMLLNQDKDISDQPENKIEVIMPDNILDQKRMMDVLEAGWQKEWEKESSGWTDL